MPNNEEDIIKRITSVEWRTNGTKSEATRLLSELKSHWVEEEIKWLEEEREICDYHDDEGICNICEDCKKNKFIDYQITHLYQKIEELKVLATPNKDI